MKKIFIILFILLIIFFVLSLLNIDRLILYLSNFYKNELLFFIDNYYFLSVLIYIFLYTIISLVPIPGDSALGLISGFFYGKYLGTLYSTIAVTLAGTLIFLISKKISYKIKDQNFLTMQKMFKKYDIYFLLSIRILPIVPTFVTNLTLSFFNIKLFTFIWTTFIGMLPILFVFAYTGQKLNEMHSIENVLSIQIIMLLSIIAFIILLPFLYKYLKIK